MAEEKFVGTFLLPPLYSTNFRDGFGTLYTAAYRPDEGTVELIWPGRTWKQRFTDFREGSVTLAIPQGAPPLPRWS